jgi:molecular chaperone DnaK (HSP70)
MRKAALKAGIIDELSSANLLLCLEPEGASIQCRNDAEEGLRNQMVKSSVVMVLDCGGGTVDITVHKLKCEPEEQFVCDELLPSRGGCEWGSKFVDHHFEMFLNEFFGPELSESYYKNATARLDILKHFEMLKRKFNVGVKSRLQLSYMNEELSGPMLKKIVAAYNAEKPKEN